MIAALVSCRDADCGFCVKLNANHIRFTASSVEKKIRPLSKGIECTCDIII